MSKFTELNYAEFKKFFSKVDFSLNVGRTEKDYEKKRESLVDSLLIANGNLQAIEVATVNGQLAITSGNRRVDAILNSEDKLKNCVFRVLDNGEMSLADFQNACNLHGSQVALTKVGIYAQVSALYNRGVIKETDIKNRLGYSKGKIQEHRKVCVLKKDLPTVESDWLKNKINRQCITELYTAFESKKKAKGKEAKTTVLASMEKLLEESKNPENTFTPLSRNSVKEYMETVPVFMSGLERYFLGETETSPNFHAVQEFLEQNKFDFNLLK